MQGRAAWRSSLSEGSLGCPGKSAGAMGNGNQPSPEPTFSPGWLDFGLASTLALKLQALTFPSTLWGWTCLSKPLHPQSLPPSLYPPECRTTPPQLCALLNQFQKK